MSILSFGFFAQSAYSQSNKIYANSPDGREFFELSDSKMLIKFDENASFEAIQKTLQQESLLKKITKTMVLPSPKNAVLAELTKPLSSDDYNAILKRLEQQPSVVYAHAFLKYEDGTLQGITNRIAVKLKSIGDFAKLDAVIRKNGLKLLEKNMYDPLVYFVQVPKNSINPLDLANQLAENGQFAWAEVDFLRLMNRFNTNDTFLANQWSLNNTGSAIQNNGTPGADMRVFNAWGISTGTNIKVAIIDEGVDLVHPDLVGNMLPGFDGTGLGSAGAPSGNDAHGTACAGIVAAVGNNNLGVAGVAYSAKIIPIRIAYSSGTSWVTTNAQIGTSLDWAWNQGGADVLSNSWGGGSSSALINDPITRATTQGRGGLGAPVLFAAGNNNGAVSYPATLQNVISVVAMSMCNQRKSTTSCDGETFWGSNFGTNADIAAPGVKIYTSDISGSAGYSTGDYTATFNGTSSACPNAAGVMALILSVNPSLNVTQARQIIESSCDKVGGYTYTAGVANQPNGTWSNDLGHGRVNAFAALQLANPQPCVNPPALSTALASPNAVCGSGTVSLSLNGATFGTGQTYQWQSSPDNTTWTNVSGQTGQSASIPVSAATWFRCLVTCGSTTPSTAVQVTINNPTINTFPHTQNFDASTSLPCGWTTQNVNADPNTWFVGATSARSTPNNIAYSYNTTLPGNDWIFTPPLNLVAGENYRVRFWYRARSATYAEKLEVKWGASASAAGMTSAAIFTNSNIINTAYTEGISSNFVAATSGIQYIGFRVFSDLDKYDLYVDDITIEAVSACTVPTVAGTISGPTTGTAGTSSTFSYTGGNGTAINWQSAIAGSFADISAATTNSLSLNLTPGTYQIRARISKTGCTDAFSNVINLTINPKVGDSFSLPIVIGSLPYNTTNSNVAGSGYSSTYTGTNQQASADVFYQFTTGSCVDSIVISSCGSAFDTYIHLLSSTGTWIASNDDNGPGCTSTSGSLKSLVLPNTTYYAVVEGYTTATGSFNLAISQLSTVGASASITANGPTTFCAGGSVNLTASAGNSFAWSNGASTQSISVNTSGNYSVTVTNANGCTSNASQGVTVNSLPTVSISADGATTFCAGGSVNLTASAGSSYAWSNGATTQSISVNATGNYSVTVTDANGCSNNAMQGVTVNALPTVSISADGPTTFCAGGSVTLTASAGSSYAWSNGATTQSISVNASGNYSVTVTNANGCTSNASQGVTVNALPTFSISANGSTTFCAGGSVTLTASAGSSYAWSNGATTQSTSVNATGNYSVTVIDANGCSNNASQGVTVNALPTVSAGTYSSVTTLSNAVTLVGTPTGGTFTGTGVSGNSFNPATSGVGTFTLTYNYTDANGCSNSAQSSITVTQACNLTASTINGPTNSCAFQGTTGGNATYSVSATDATSYTWTLPAGSTNITGQGTNTISFKFSSTYTTGTVSVVVGGCSTTASRSITVTRATPATPGVVSGTSNVCSIRGTTQTNTYSIAPVADAISYLWVAPANTVIISGQGTTSITLQANAAFTTGSITVLSSSGCANSSSRSFALSVAIPATPGTVTGTSRACPGNTFTYTVAAVANASSYNWTVPTGATIVSGSGTNSIQVNFNAGFVATGNISVTATNGCGTSAARTYSVARNTPATPGTIAGQTSGICSATVNYSVTNVAGMTYTWTAPAGTSIATGQGTNAITLSVTPTFVSGTLSVNASNSCSTSANRTASLTARPATPASITGLATAVCIGSQQTYSVAALPGATSYTWTVPASYSIVSGQGTNSIVVNIGTANGNITARGNNACGSGSTRSLTVAVVSCARMAEESIESAVEFDVVVSPNPFNETLNIRTNGANNEKLQISIVDVSGRIVFNNVAIANETLNISPNLANGIYYVSVTNSADIRKLLKVIKAN